MNSWNRATIFAVIDGLQANKVVECGGIIFIRAMPSAEDNVEMQFNMTARACGGGCAINLHRSVIKQYAEAGSLMAAQILDLAEGEDESIPAAAFTNGTFKPEHGEILPFIMAHEVGHIVLGHHISTTKEMVEERANTEEVHPHEFEADDFARDVLGTTDHAIVMFGHVLTHLGNALKMGMLEGAEQAVVANVVIQTTKRLEHAKA